MKIVRAVIAAAAALALAAAVQLATSNAASASPTHPDCVKCWEIAPDD